VPGDTTAAFAAARAGCCARGPVGHVEAGLRSYDFKASRPEDMNRCIAARISPWGFAPTELSPANLVPAGIPGSNAHATGNTVVDGLLWMRECHRALTVERVKRLR
jgi:UDP-N-acetylglucosamine 2-epimerase (non-hydrolysing)